MMKDLSHGTQFAEEVDFGSTPGRTASELPNRARDGGAVRSLLVFLVVAALIAGVGVFLFSPQLEETESHADEVTSTDQVAESADPTSAPPQPDVSKTEAEEIAEGEVFENTGELAGEPTADPSPPRREVAVRPAPGDPERTDEVFQYHFLSETLNPAWIRAEPVAAPPVADSELEQAMEAVAPPSGALELWPLLGHPEDAPELNLVFAAAGAERLEARERTRVHLAHDGSDLYLFAQMELPEGKNEPAPDHGVWPTRDEEFDNTEFVALAFDDGESTSLADSVIFVDWLGNIRVRTFRAMDILGYGDRARALRKESEWEEVISKATSVEVKRHGGVWRLAARISLDPLTGDPTWPGLRFNVGRVTGEPEAGLPLQATSLSGSLIGPNRFPDLVLAQDATDSPTALAVRYGDRTRWRTYPRGPQRAGVVLLADASHRSATIRHVVQGEGGRQVVHEERVRPQEGLNSYEWDWDLRPDWNEFRESIEVDGRSVNSGNGRAEEWLFVSPLQFRLGARDKLTFHADLGATPEVLENLRLEVQVTPDGGRATEWTIDSIEGPGVQGLVDLAGLNLAPGEHQLEVTLRRGSQTLESASHSFEVQADEVIVPDEWEIALVDASELESGAAPYPVRNGIPFPQGWVFSADELELVDDEGRPVPCALTVVARWSGDRSVKWVHLDFEYDPAQAYFLRPGERVVRDGGEVVVREEEEQITISNGILEVTVGREGFDGFRSVRRILEDGQVLDYTVGAGGFFAVGEGGVRFDSGNAPGRTEVEEANSERVTLKFTGSCQSADGVGVLNYILRVTLQAGVPGVELMLTIILTAHTRMHRFQEIGMETGVGAGSALNGFTDFPTSFRLQQRDPGTLRMESGQGWREVDAEDAEFVFGGEQAVAFAIRDMVEKAPFEIRYDVEYGVELMFWPDLADFEGLSADEVTADDLPRLPFAHQGPLLDFNVPPEYLETDGVTGNTRTAYMPNGIELGNAMGVARTREILIQFGPVREIEDSMRGQAYLGRRHLVANQEWMAATRAVGNLPMSPQREFDDQTLLGRTEKVLDRQFDWEMRMLEPVEQGIWTWGAGHSSWDGQRWSPWRLFRNSHHGGPKGYWYLFARSADPKYLAYARRSTEHVADVGMPHYADTDLGAMGYFGKDVGAVCDYKGYVPWHSGNRFDYNTYADYLLSWYYLTGHPRARDTLDNMQEFYLDHRRAALGASRDRPGASRMETAGSLYMDGLDGRLIRYLHASLQSPLEDQTEIGYIPTRKGFGSWLQYYLDLTGNPEALEILRKWAWLDINIPWFGEVGGTGWMLPYYDIQGYAYIHWPEPELLQTALARLEREVLDAAVLDGSHAWDGFFTAGNNQWNFLHQKLPSFLWAMEQAGEVQPRRILETFGSTRPPSATDDWIVTSFEVDDDWTTWAVFDGDPDQSFALRFQGYGPEGGSPEMRMVTADGQVIHEGDLPEFDWTPRDANPMVEVEIDPGSEEGPYYLQVRNREVDRGSSRPASPIIPFSDLPKEVYPTNADGAFGTNSGHRRLYFQVPESGDRIGISGLAKGRYRIILRDDEGSEVAREKGNRFQSGLGIDIPVDAQSLRPLRGQVAEFDAIQQRSEQVFRHETDIPPYVSLSRERFFVPPPLP